MMRYHHRAVAAAAGLFLAAAAPLAAQEWTWSGSMHYSTDRYIFTERTTTWALFNGLGLRSGRLRLSASMPIVFQNTGALTYVGGSPFPTGGPDYRVVRQRRGDGPVPMTPRVRDGPRDGRSSGTMMPASASVSDTVSGPGGFQADLGDPFLSGGIEIYRGWDVLRSIELTAATKVPLRSLDSGIGTGEWDYAGGAAVTLGVGRVLVFGDASYWRYGDLPDLELRDGVHYAAGLGIPVGARSSLMASFAGSGRIIETVDAARSLMILGSHRIGESAALNAGIDFGLTEASADVSVFLGWRVGLAPRGGRVAAANR